MKFFEFGTDHDKLMVMLHGGGVSYLGAVPVAECVAKKFHVVLVAYDGFNPSEPEKEFTSVMDEEKQIAEYVLKNYGGKIDVLYGVSYGCRVLNEALRDERLIYTKATWNSWRNQDRCLIGHRTDYEAFKNTDMYIWYGINSTVERRLAKNIKQLQDAGHQFTLKIFKDVGHGGLAGEQPERFLKEVIKAHEQSLEKTGKATGK